MAIYSNTSWLDNYIAPVFQWMETRGFLYKATGILCPAVRAPPVLIICDGLKRMGEEDLAAEIARNFCELCKKSGFAENFEPMLGLNQEDPSYTWTASIFLILAADYLE